MDDITKQTRKIMEGMETSTPFLEKVKSKLRHFLKISQLDDEDYVNDVINSGLGNLLQEIKLKASPEEKKKIRHILDNNEDITRHVMDDEIEDALS